MRLHKIFIPFAVLVFSVFFMQTALAGSKTKQPLRKIRFGVSYIPNVQFAPLYIAQKKGFYAKEGLDVQLMYGYENDFIKLAAQGECEFAIASGDQIILARGQGIPITYVMKWYQRYPVALMIPASKNISKMSDLTGKSVGLPGFFGATFVGWKALVYSSGIDESKVAVRQIGFTQASALQQNLVDAAMVYVVNEPIQLHSAGIKSTLIKVSDNIDLVANGLAVGDKLMKSDPDLVRKMIKATKHGIIYSINHPKEAFLISQQIIPEITKKNSPMQQKVLEASIELWKSAQYGISEKKSWQKSVDFMRKTGLLNNPVEVDKLYTNEFIETP